MSIFKKVLKPQEYRNEKMTSAIIEMKLSKNNLNRQAKKMEKSAAKAKQKLKKALENQDIETAKIHAESAVRSQSAARNFYQMAGRVDAVCGRMREAMATQQLTGNMTKVVKGMSAALSTMTPENIAVNLQQFEDLSDTLEVNADFMNITINNATGVSEQNDVSELLEHAAQELNIENLGDLEQATGLPVPIAEQPTTERQRVEEI